MKNRVLSPKDERYARYGGRGITICDEWLAFVTFRDWALLNGYENHLTIDRTDNESGYCPENCRWVTRLENGKNKTIYPMTYIYKADNKWTVRIKLKNNKLGYFGLFSTIESARKIRDEYLINNKT